MGTDRGSQGVGPSGKLADWVREHVDSANRLLEQSHQAAQRAAARVEQTSRRVQQTSRRVGHVAGAAQEAYQATSATVDRFVQVKQRELTAHQRALGVHEQAAQLQERLGYPDRAAEARAHAQHARELYRLAGEELAVYQARIAAAKDGAGRAPRRSS